MPMKKLSKPISDHEARNGLFLLVAAFFCMPSILSELNRLLPTPVDTVTLNLVYHIVNLIGAVSVFYAFIKRSCLQARERIGRIVVFALIGFVVYHIVLALLSQIILLLKPDFANFNDNNIAAQLQTRWIPVAIGTVLIAPFTEELIFRGVLFGHLYNKHPVTACILSVCAFSSVHILGYIHRADILTLALSFLQYLPAGLVLAWVYAKTDSIFTPILLHTMINAIGIYTMR